MSAAPIGLLRRLNDIDERIYALKTRREAAPAAVAQQRKRIAAHEREAAEHKERIKTTQVEVHGQEVDLQTREATVAKLLGQRNTAGTNKEYKAFDHQIEIEKMEIRKIEDRVLDLMAQGETLTAELSRVQAEQAEASAELARLEARAHGEMQSIESALAALEADRRATAAEVKPEILDKYERVVAKYSGHALASASGGACQGCHMAVTQQEINLLLGQGQILYCRSCNRILYLPDEPTD